MPQLSILKAACVAFLVASPASAVTLAVGGVDYDFTTVTGSFVDNSSLLEGQVWWKNQILAKEFADIAGPALAPSPSTPSPLFAFDAAFGSVVGFAVGLASGSATNATTLGSPDTTSLTFAVATPTVVSAVPLPAGAVLLLTGLGGLAASRRKPKVGA